MKKVAKHGEKAVEALMKEYAQLDEFNVFKQLDASSLTKEEKAGSLQVLNLLKEKCDRMLKGRTCVDGSPQRSYISKEESPHALRQAFQPTSDALTEEHQLTKKQRNQPQQHPSSEQRRRVRHQRTTRLSHSSHQPTLR